MGTGFRLACCAYNCSCIFIDFAGAGLRLACCAYSCSCIVIGFAGAVLVGTGLRLACCACSCSCIVKGFDDVGNELEFGVCEMVSFLFVAVGTDFIFA